MSPASAIYRVEVRLRAELSDAPGQSALALLRSSGVPAREVRTSQIFEVRGPFNNGHLQQAAKELLCDGVTQEFRVAAPGAPTLNGFGHWRVEVWLKPSVSDCVGETVGEAITELGLPKPERVRCAAGYLITGHCGRHQLEKAINRTLANPVIHDVRIAESHG